VSGLRLKTASILGLLLVFGFLAAANFVPKEQRVESGFWPDDGLRLGLDLRGGIHWVVGVKIDDAILHELEFVRENMREVLTDDGVIPARMTIEAGQLSVEVRPDELVTLRRAAGQTNVLREMSEEGGTLAWVLTEDWTQNIRERTMLQVLEVLRRRINDPVRGIPDSIVTRQGVDRVLVQIPGGQIDRGRARQLLKSTGFLEFKIVLDRADTVEALEARHVDTFDPETQEVVTELDPETDQIVAAYLVKTKADVTGDYLDDARVGFDPQQRPLVNFRFNAEGGRIFGELTEANIEQLLAIILDQNVYSAPVIRSRITTRGQITGRFSSQQAADLAVVLRAGALSVPVVIEEERTVGPALGQDSIDSGVSASVLGLLLVLVFTVLYYRMSGGYAAIALIFNMVLILGVMSLFEATLTLPGIAGLVLTVGMAVDANVIIFERIREELRAGKTPRAAVATGFNKATWTVLDANITTLITALILFQFGTGPIKGFAVTLSIGILTSVFSALVGTRLLFQIYPGGRTVQQLSI
jgi:preprotein translocase subunit SecD